MTRSWLSFPFQEWVDRPTVLHTDLGYEEATERVQAVTATGPWWRPSPPSKTLVGQVGDRWFRVRVPGGRVTGNPHMPVLLGRLAARPQGADVQLEIERPQLWRGRVTRLAVMTILPTAFVVGLIGVLTGTRDDAGGSMWPFVLGPLGLAAAFTVFDYALRREARLQERRLCRRVIELLALREA